MSRTPAWSSRSGIGTMPHSGMPGAPFGPTLRSTSTESASMSSAGSSMRAATSSTSSNTTARPRWRSSVGSAEATLRTAPRGASEPRRTARPPAGLTGSSSERTTAPMPGRALSPMVDPPIVIASRSSRSPSSCSTAGTPPARVQLVDQMGAGGTHVGEHGRAARQLVEPLERQLVAGASRQREQVDHGVGRSAERAQHGDRVVERRRRQDLRRPQVVQRDLDRPPAGRLADGGAARGQRRDGRRAGQRHAERLGDAGHRRGRAHLVAVAGARDPRRLELVVLVQRDLARAQLVGVAPAGRCRRRARGRGAAPPRRCRR